MSNRNDEDEDFSGGIVGSTNATDGGGGGGGGKVKGLAVGLACASDTWPQ